MFSQLSERLTQTLKKIRGEVRLTEANLQETLREIRIALLEADVALPVVKEFVQQVKEKALGTEVAKSLNPGQMFVKQVHQELIRTLGAEPAELNLRATPPVVILMAGLQGSGKTTTAGKLARLLKQTHKKSVMLVSCDVYRPAAIQQLEILAKQVEVAFFPSSSTEKPLDIAQKALDQAKRQAIDVVIVDTAGRLAIDEDMMREIEALQTAIQPTETLFVIDSMTGQDAVNTAQKFNAVLDLTGIVLTKVDGDTRGGAALSVRHITGKPIKFVGVGEKLDALEAFHADRIASQILGMGDLLTFIEQAQQKVDQEKAQAMAKKIQSGGRFTLQDFADQLQQLEKMGGVGSLMNKLPGVNQLPAQLLANLPLGSNKKNLAIIGSMTPAERTDPTLLKASRKLRIAKGSGTQVQDINRLLKQFEQIQGLMKKVMGKKDGMKKMLRNFQGMLPPKFR